jgi:hypothetical protein
MDSTKSTACSENSQVENTDRKWQSITAYVNLNVTIASTVLEDIYDKPIRIQSYCAVARLHGVWEKETEDLLRDIQWINFARCRVAPTVQLRSPVIG